MRNSSSLDWLRFMHTPNDYRVSQVKLICLPCLVWLALLFFSLFCLFSWGQQIFSADYSYTCEVFFLSFLVFRILYRIV